MLALNAQTRIAVCVQAVDFRRGIDGLAHYCRAHLGADPFCGTVFVFRNRRKTAIKILAYDGQGFWLCQKRLSKGTFRHWPSQGTRAENAAGGIASDAHHTACAMLAHELSVLIQAGDPKATQAAPPWRRVTPKPD